MSVTVIQQPTTPNVAYTKLPFVVSGSGTTSNPQYSYVMDVYESGSTSLISRQLCIPNPFGVAVFEPSTIIQGNLQNDEFWKITGSISPINSVKTFDLRFGEAYGTSTSSSVTVYTGSTSNYLQIFPGTVDINGGSYNFNTGSFISQSGGNTYLSNSPNYSPLTGTPPRATKQQISILANSSDYLTVTTLKDTDATPNSMEIIGYRIQNGFITGSPVQVNITIPAGTTNSSFSTFGVGPQNLAATSSAWSASLADPNGINIYQSNSDTGEFVVFINDKWDGVVPSSAFNYGVFSLIGYPTRPCNDEYTRFAWINKLGFWDYYNVYNPIQRSSELTKDNVNIPKLDYSSTLSPYDITSRGITNYFTDYSDSYQITTEYLDQRFSTWLEELLESPSVYIQKQDEFVPVIITDSSYIANTNQSRQKLFQYTITFTPAKGRELFI